jgi:NAD(P)-dependent dehydrogenase (short-subunit alcohol dehydrogenase family)
MTGKVAIISGASRGIGAGLVTGYRRQGWAVVASARMIKPSGDPDLLTVAGDIADPETAERIVGGALGRFGRIDTLVNNAGAFISKPFTDYTAADYALAVGASLTDREGVHRRPQCRRGAARPVSDQQRQSV